MSDQNKAITFSEKLRAVMRDTLYKPKETANDHSLYSRELGEFSSYTEYVAKMNGIKDYKEVLLLTDEDSIAPGTGINIEDYKESIEERLDIFDSETDQTLFGFSDKTNLSDKDRRAEAYKREMEKLYYKRKESSPFQSIGYSSLDEYVQESSSDYKSRYWMPKNDPNPQDNNKEIYEKIDKRMHHFGLPSEGVEEDSQIRSLLDDDDLPSDLNSKEAADRIYEMKREQAIQLDKECREGETRSILPLSIIRRYKNHPDIIYLHADDEDYAYTEEQYNRFSRGEYPDKGRDDYATLSADEFKGNLDSISLKAKKKIGIKHLGLDPELYIPTKLELLDREYRDSF